MIVTKPATCSTKRSCAATSWRCGTPAASTTSAWRPSPGRTGLIVRFVLTERRVIRSIKYEGIQVGHRLRNSGPLQGAQGRPVAWNRSTIPNKIQRAAVVLKEFLAERGRQYATVDPQIEQIPPSSLEGHVQRQRRPQGEGRATSTSPATQAFNDRWVIRDDEEPEALSASRTRSSSRTSSPRPSTRPSSKRTRSASARPIRTTATSRPRRSTRPCRSSATRRPAAGASR